MTLYDLINQNPDATDAQIVALAQADKRTVRAIPLDELTPYLTKNGLQYKFDLAAKNENVPDELRAALFSFNNYLAGGNKNLDTNDAELAPIIYSVMQGAIAVQILTQQQADDIVALGGGFLLASTTEEDVARARREIIASDLIAQSKAWEQQQNTAIANRAATFVSAVEAWASSGEGEVPSIEGI